MRRVKIVHALTFDALEDCVNEALAELEQARHIPRKIKVVASRTTIYAYIIFEPKHEGVVE